MGGTYFFSVVLGASLMMVVSFFSPGGLTVTCFSSQEVKNSGAKRATIRYNFMVVYGVGAGWEAFELRPVQYCRHQES